MNNKRVLYAFFIILWLFASTKYCFAQKQQPSANQLIDGILNSYHRDSEKDNYPRVLDSLQEVVELINDERAGQYVKLVRIQHLFETATIPSQKALFLNSARNIFNETKHSEIRGFYYILRGQYAFGEKNFVESLPFYLQAKEYLEEAQYESLPYATYFYNHFFDVYYYFEEFQSAADFCEKALKKPDLDLYSHYGYYNNLGLCYIKLKNYKKAEEAFKNGILASKRRNYKNFEALVIGNWGNLKRLQGKFKEALPMLYHDVEVNHNIIPENAAISKFYIAQCLIMTDSLDKAKQYVIPPNFKMPVWSYPSYDLIKYETLALYYDKVGNFKLGGVYKDSLLALKDILKVRLDSKKLIVLESMQKIENVKKNYGHKSLIFISTFVLVLIVFVGVVFWMNTKRKRNQRHLENSLDNARGEMERYLQLIKEKNKLLEQVEQEIHGRKNVSKEHEERVYLEVLNKSVILTKENWEEFKILFERIYPSFFLTISKDYPDLTSAEVRLLALEKLNLSSKIMGNMLGILPASVRKTRYRLRQKYPDLLPHENLVDDEV